MFKHTKRLKNHHQDGNAMVYVLIALALFGFLTITLSSQNDQADGQDISDEQTALYANELMSYVASAQNAVDMMIATGTQIDDLDFVIPSDAAFNTPPHYNKVFHPQGGGLNYFEKFSDGIGGPDSASPIKRWRVLQTTNVEWTPTTSNDVLFTAYNIKPEICSVINKKITNSPSIPTLNDNITNTFALGTIDLDTVNCAACAGYPSLCVENSVQTAYAFYNIIAAQ